MAITQQDHETLADEFTNIKVTVAQVKKVLKDHGFEPSDKNVDYLIDKGFLLDVEKAFIQQLEEEMAHILNEQEGEGKYPELKPLD